MPSAYFARIKRDCMVITACIPVGKLTTFTILGKHLDVPPRHVAYVLATLTQAEQSTLPWWRVVGDGGQLGKVKLGEQGITQAEFLDDEGVRVEDLQVQGFEAHCVDTLELNSGIAQQTRPADAPVR